MYLYLHSLRLRAQIAAVLVVVGLSLAYSFNASRLVLEGGKTAVESSVKQVAELLNLAASPYASMGGLPVLQDFLEGMLGLIKDKENGLVYLVILADDGETLVAVGKGQSPLPIPDASIRDAVGNGIVHVRNPILLRGNRVGALQFGISTRHVLETQQAILLEGLILSGSIALLVMLFLFAVGHSVSRRLDRLVRVSQQIAAGNYDVDFAEAGGHDEIALLAGTNMEMVSAISRKMRELKDSQRWVEDLNASLEEMVELRTRQLEEKNAELATTIDNLQLTRESLVLSEKLAGLGAVVAGVAHELNTPIGNALTVSTTQSARTRSFIAEMERGLKRSTLQSFAEQSMLAADLIQRNLSRAAELVYSFKQVAVDQSSAQKRVFNLKESINEYLLMLHPMLKKTPYQVEVDIPPELTMSSYPGPLCQVITNFVNNSVVHGFDGRRHGIMRVQAEASSDGWLRLIYSDDGSGIPARNLNHIFDPFFTTRLGKGGSGLGLNIVFNIVTKVLGGTIDVHSAPGEGTWFVLILPQEAPVPAEKEEQAG